MGFNVDEFASFLTGREHNNAIDESEESMILTHTDVKAGVMLGTSLAFEDISGFAVGAAEDFHTKSFAF